MDLEHTGQIAVTRVVHNSNQNGIFYKSKEAIRIFKEVVSLLFNDFSSLLALYLCVFP